jgi:mono/diheme cytochrome c family protein
MLKRVGRLVLILLALVGVAALSLLVELGAGGIASTGTPGPLERFVAGRLRSLAIPTPAKSQPNPVALTSEAVDEGLAHFADHCASCHANDGSGETEMGRGLYPKPPDMRLDATQRLSDGELFYIIENGVKLTGMPAWGDGTPEGQAASWRLVHFIRRLPQLTSEELDRMKALNPRSPDEWRMDEEIRQFLAGERDAPPGEASHQH